MTPEAQIELGTLEREERLHQQCVNEINADIGKLIARRGEYEKLIREARTRMAEIKGEPPPRRYFQNLGGLKAQSERTEDD